MSVKLTLVIVALLILAGCATADQKPQESGFRIVDAGQKQEPGTQNPNDMVTIFVNAHGNVMNELEDIKAANKQALTDLGEIKATSRQALETAQRSLQLIEEMSKRQGTGEITVFFPINWLRNASRG